jgi:hypothetical protein
MISFPNAKITIIEPNVLVVEGREDRRFFAAMIAHLGLNRIQIYESEGKSRLREKLAALAGAPGCADLLSIIVVRDADDDPTAAFQSVRDALAAAGLPAPSEPMAAAGERPRVTVVIMPEPDLPGALEDACLKAVGQDPAVSCVERFFQCLGEQRLPRPRSMSKARVQAFLASREEPGLRLGEAAEKGYWPWDENVFNPLKTILQQIGSQKDDQSG